MIDDDKIPNQLDALRLFALGTEVVDPRISSEERGKIIDEMLAIDQITTALILGSYAAGFMNQLAARVPLTVRNSYIESMLVDFRKNISTASLSFLPEE